MKIFLSFLQGKPGHPIPAYSFWEYYIKNGIEEAGYSWVEAADVDWAYGLVTQSAESLNAWKTEVWEKTLRTVKETRPDILITYLYPHQVDESAITEIKTLGIPVVNFFCDNIREFRKTPKEFGSFSLNWVPEFKALSQYKSAGFKYIHLPMPMWVEPQYRKIPLKEIDQVSFIGSQDIQRQLLFEEVVKKQPSFDLGIYGAAWTQGSDQATPAFVPPSGAIDQIKNQVDYIAKEGVGAWYRKLKQRNISIPYTDALQKALKGKPDFNEYVRISQSSKVTLGVNRYPSYRYPLDKPDTYSRLRDIEAPMLGACYLTEWAPGIEEMYQIGKEVGVYKSAEEMIAKIDMLVNNKELRNNLRKAGQERALSEHGIPSILNKIKNNLQIRS